MKALKILIGLLFLCGAVSAQRATTINTWTEYKYFGATPGGFFSLPSNNAPVPAGLEGRYLLRHSGGADSTLEIWVPSLARWAKLGGSGSAASTLDSAFNRNDSIYFSKDGKLTSLGTFYQKPEAQARFDISVTPFPDSSGWRERQGDVIRNYKFVYVGDSSEAYAFTDDSTIMASRAYARKVGDSIKALIPAGATGPAGKGIASVARTSGNGAAGTTDTYTITYTDATTQTYNIVNGANGATGAAGRGITSIVRTAGNGAAGTTDTYTITYTDATTQTYTIVNGAEGPAGPPGPQGPAGATGTASAAGTTDGDIQYKSGTTLAASTGLNYAPAGDLKVVSSGSGGGLWVENPQTLGAGSGAGIKAKTTALPTAAGQRMGFYTFGSNSNNSAGMFGWSNKSWASTSDRPAYLTFETTPDGSTTRQERLRIAADGLVSAGGNMQAAGFIAIPRASEGTTVDGEIWRTNVSTTLRTNISGAVKDILTDQHPSNVRLNVLATNNAPPSTIGTLAPVVSDQMGNLSFAPNGPPLDRRSEYYTFNDFDQRAEPSPFAELTSGGGSIGVTGTAELNRPGQWERSTAASATGLAAVGNLDSYMKFGGGVWSFETAIYIPDLSTATERFATFDGFGDNFNNIVTTDQTGFIYDEGGVATGTASPNFQLVTSSASTRTFYTTSVPVLEDTWYQLKVVVNATGTSAQFYINGLPVGPGGTGPITTNIPTTGSTGVMQNILKSVGTTARKVWIDWTEVRCRFTTPR
jgi:hypothetical protein